MLYKAYMTTWLNQSNLSVIVKGLEGMLINLRSNCHWAQTMWLILVSSLAVYHYPARFFTQTDVASSLNKRMTVKRLC